MKSKDEVMNDALSDFDGRMPSVRQYMKSRFNGVWENGYCHGYAQGVEVGKADVQNKLDVIDEIKQGEFNRGFKAGQCKEEIEQLKKDEFTRGWDAGRERGVEEGSKIKLKALEDRERSGYLKGYAKGHADGKALLVQKDPQEAAIELLQANGWMIDHDKKMMDMGLEAAWEAVKRIESLPEDGGLTNEEIADVFDQYVDSFHLYRKFDVHEAIRRLNEFQARRFNKAEIGANLQVGDSVYDEAGNVCVITNIGSHVHVIYTNGKTHKWNKRSKFVKTGRCAVIDLNKKTIDVERCQP